MNTQTNPMPESSQEAQAVTPAEIPFARLLYWSLRRELWEYRSIYLAPLAVAAVSLFAFLCLAIGVRISGGWAHHLAQPGDMLAMPYEVVAGLIMGTAVIVGVFYALDALYGERRDRSILFWKSLPVSDLITVLSKFMIPLLLLPLLSFAITVVTQFLMLLLSSAVLLGSGLNIASLWGHSSFLYVSMMLLYHILTVHGLWYAPIYAWLLLVSAWSPRAPFIWAFLPPFVIWGVERIAFNTSYIRNWLVYRLIGPEPAMAAHSNDIMDVLAALTPLEFFTTTGLWTGLALAAVFLTVTIRLRRYRGPI